MGLVEKEKAQSVNLNYTEGPVIVVTAVWDVWMKWPWLNRYNIQTGSQEFFPTQRPFHETINDRNHTISALIFHVFIQLSFSRK